MKHDPEYGPAHIGLGNIEYAARRCDEALLLYRKAATYAVTKSRAWCSIGNSYFCQGRLDLAVTAYQYAIDLAASGDMNLGLYHLTRGVSLCKSGRYSEGLAELQTAQGLAAGNTSLSDAVAAEAANCHEASAPAAGQPDATPTPAASPTPGVVTGTPTRTASRTATAAGTVTTTMTVRAATASVSGTSIRLTASPTPSRTSAGTGPTPPPPTATKTPASQNAPSATSKAVRTATNLPTLVPSRSPKATLFPTSAASAPAPK